MAGPKNIDIKDIVDAAHLDATKPDHVELFQYRLSIATSDATQKMLVWGASKKMLVTLILCDTSAPHRMIALADIVLNASSKATNHRVAFDNLFLANMEYEQIASIGDLDDVDKARSKLGYALNACLPLLAREVLEKVAIDFSARVRELKMKEMRSIIEVVRFQGTPDFAPNPDRSTMTAETRSRYIQEMDQDGLFELLSRLNLAKSHTEALRREALGQLSIKTRRKK